MRIVEKLALAIGGLGHDDQNELRNLLGWDAVASTPKATRGWKTKGGGGKPFWIAPVKAWDCTARAIQKLGPDHDARKHNIKLEDVPDLDEDTLIIVGNKLDPDNPVYGFAKVKRGASVDIGGLHIDGAERWCGTADRMSKLEDFLLRNRKSVPHVKIKE